jgi:Protein of unknown function (DUF3592)
VLFAEISIVPIAFIVVGGSAVWSGFELRERAQRMITRPSVRGAVTGTAIVADGTFEDGSAAYSPRISYKYVVAGKEYSGQRRSLINVPTGRCLRAGLRTTVDRFPVGSEVIVFYDPADPGEAILERPDPVIGPTLLSAFGAMLAVGLPLWIWLTTHQ